VLIGTNDDIIWEFAGLKVNIHPIGAGGQIH
jgi:hypothetical protein